MHGPNDEPYLGSYEDSTLSDYAQKFTNWQKEGKTIYCYFDNGEKASAPKDAQRMCNLLS